MREQFQGLPSVLQKQILIRLAGSASGMVMSLLILVYHGSAQLLIPGVVICFSFLVNAAVMFSSCTGKRYVIIHGTCNEIARSNLRRKLKAVYLENEGKSVKIMGQLQSLRNLRIGDRLEVYISDSAPVYQNDGIFVITQVMAVRKVR